MASFITCYPYSALRSDGISSFVISSFRVGGRKVGAMSSFANDLIWPRCEQVSCTYARNFRNHVFLNLTCYRYRGSSPQMRLVRRSWSCEDVAATSSAGRRNLLCHFWHHPSFHKQLWISGSRTDSTSIHFSTIYRIAVPTLSGEAILLELGRPVCNDGVQNFLDVVVHQNPISMRLLLCRLICTDSAC